MNHASHPSTTSSKNPADDILDRDEHGAPKYSFIPIAPLPRDDSKEEHEIESRLIETYKKQFCAQREAARKNKALGIGGAAGSWGQSQAHQLWLSAGADPTISEQEMKSALQAYLNGQVASLDEDAWMFDGDDGSTL
jgi:hypothetical protein